MRTRWPRSTTRTSCTGVEEEERPREAMAARALAPPGRSSVGRRRRGAALARRACAAELARQPPSGKPRGRGRLRRLPAAACAAVAARVEAAEGLRAAPHGACGCCSGGRTGGSCAEKVTECAEEALHACFAGGVPHQFCTRRHDHWRPRRRPPAARTIVRCERPAAPNGLRRPGRPTPPRTRRPRGARMLGFPDTAAAGCRGPKGRMACGGTEAGETFMRRQKERTGIPCVGGEGAEAGTARRPACGPIDESGGRQAARCWQRRRRMQRRSALAPTKRRRQAGSRRTRQSSGSHGDEKLQQRRGSSLPPALPPPHAQRPERLLEPDRGERTQQTHAPLQRQHGVE